MVIDGLDSVVTHAQVNDVSGALKILALKIAEIARSEERRHIFSGRNDSELVRALTFYKEACSAYGRDYGIDCSGFNSAVRSIVPGRYYNLID